MPSNFQFKIIKTCTNLHATDPGPLSLGRGSLTLEHVAALLGLGRFVSMLSGAHLEVQDTWKLEVRR